MKPLPQADQVEKSVLGEILVSGNSENFEGLKPEHFASRSNRLIYQTYLMMDQKGEKPDSVTVTSKLKDLKILEEVGGVSYISSLPYVIAGNPSQYVPILEEKLRLRKIIELADMAMNQAYSQEVDSLKIVKGMELSSFCLESTDNSGSLTQKAINELFKAIESKRKGEKLFGLKTGIQSWDVSLGGLRKSRFYVVAARAGKGKTALIEQIITCLLVHGHAVLIFEKDMSIELLISRMSCRQAGVPFSRFDVGECSPKEYDEIEKWAKIFEKAPLYTYSPTDFTPAAMASIIRREKKVHDIKAVFVDHILNLKISGDFRTGLTQASTIIRASVEETEIPHVILAQLNREGHGNTRPTPVHIKEFDALYADCDAMMMLWSEKDTHDVPKGELFPVKFTCNKNRYGSEFEDELGFDRPLMTFKTMVNHK